MPHRQPASQALTYTHLLDTFCLVPRQVCEREREGEREGRKKGNERKGRDWIDGKTRFLR